MGQIVGDENTINEVKTAKPGDPHVYVNMEAINELPDQFEVHIKKVKFDFGTDFVNVGNDNFMPTPDLMNDIGDARGVHGTDEIKIESIKEEIDINPLLCLGPEHEPTLRTMIVGKRVIKTGKVRNEDGTWRNSDPCSVDFNVWERCLIEWSKEEERTDGYNPDKQKKNQRGSVYYEYEWYDKESGKSKTGSYYPKYNTRQKRQLHFNETMKFAQRNADTKARNVVIRVLAGLKTGYKKGELSKGYFIFPQIQKSKKVLKAELAADLTARAAGIGTRGNQAGNLLFGPPDSAPEAAAPPVDDDFPTEEPKPVQPEPEKVTPRKHLIAILEAYKKDELIHIDYLKAAEKILAWLKATEKAEEDKTYWPKGIEIFRQLESKIPPEARIDHKLY